MENGSSMTIEGSSFDGKVLGTDTTLVNLSNQGITLREMNSEERPLGATENTLAWRVNGGSSPRLYSKEEPVVDMVPPFNPVRIPDSRKIEGHMRLYGGGAGVDTYACAMEECARS